MTGFTGFTRLQDFDRRSSLAFALRMGRAKIRHSTCEHARVRLFMPTYPDTSGFFAPIGESGYEGASNLQAVRLRLGKAGARTPARYRISQGKDNRAPGQARDRLTAGWPEGRAERERTSQPCSPGWSTGAKRSNESTCTVKAGTSRDPGGLGSRSGDSRREPDRAR